MYRNSISNDQYDAQLLYDDKKVAASAPTVKEIKPSNKINRNLIVSSIFSPTLKYIVISVSYDTRIMS